MGDVMKVSISKGNTKLGKLPNISLTLVKACGKDVPCKKDCYALKSYRMYPNVRKNWDENLAAYRKDPEEYFEQIARWIIKHKPKFFRWHVAGDIVDKEYAYGMAWIAQDNPGTQFLAFTKRPELLPAYRIENLQFIYSCWPGHKIPQRVGWPGIFNGSPAGTTSRYH
jgi:hypothetical protein